MVAASSEAAGTARAAQTGALTSASRSPVASRNSSHAHTSFTARPSLPSCLAPFLRDDALDVTRANPCVEPHQSRTPRALPQYSFVTFQVLLIRYPRSVVGWLTASWL